MISSRSRGEGDLHATTTNRRLQTYQSSWQSSYLWLLSSFRKTSVGTSKNMSRLAQALDIATDCDVGVLSFVSPTNIESQNFEQTLFILCLLTQPSVICRLRAE